ncbi:MULTISPECIES: ATP-binding protein [Thalassospira]|uniref:histidine kinase n=2 Tax=Thalassospira TaxID=168934 RepID=A0A367W9E8_9PROT|nr:MULTISPECIES: ATP-binding protein [Thalassospira]MDG4719256.1 ATP-binding protein [Thalassospira sp. FZY0004]RCK37172.1 histidine kinase [Thalassospira profundimaris]
MKIKQQNSLQFVLIKRLTVIVALCWVAGSILAAYSMYHELEEASDTGLVETARRGSTLIETYLDAHSDGSSVVVMPTPAGRIVGSDNDDDDDSEDDYLMYQLRAANGDVLLRSHNAVAEPFEAPIEVGFYQDDDFRIYTAQSPDGELFMQVAEPMDHRHEAILESVAAQFLPIGLLIPAVIIGIILGVRQGLVPVQRVRDEIEARGEGNLTPIEQEEAPEEITTIVSAVNSLMGKLEAALNVERSFTANSAHELRTPIAVALAQTQRLVLELPEGHEARKRALQTEASLKRLSRLSEKLLQLARAEAGGGFSPTGYNQKLGSTLALVVDDLTRAGADGGAIRFDPDNIETLEANIDLDAFAICLRNLIENALKYGSKNEPVEITVVDRNIVRVSNGGPALETANLDDLKTRFKRSHKGGDGSGLGLAIVDAIVRNTRAELNLYSPRPGKADGFMAELKLHQS